MGKAKSKPGLPTERHIEETCTEFLALDGWRCVKTDLPHLRGLGVQEKGMADRLYIRYPADLWPYERPLRCFAEIMWIEWKSKRGKAQPHQLAWHAEERARGALTLIAGEDFPKTIDGFIEYYRQSGLMRRDIHI